MTMLMLNRPRPALRLLALLYGGFAMGTTAGPGTDHRCARHGYIGGAGELAVVTTELAQQRPLSQASAG
jgi:hypothetical protein